MTEIKYRLLFDGGEADRGRLPAHGGATSIEGFTWSFALLANYAAVGKIRYRGEMSPRTRVYLLPARQGSFIVDFAVWLSEPENLFLSSIAGSYAVATVGQAFNSLVVSTFKSVCGLSPSLGAGDERRLAKLPSGDREALVDRIEPAMKRAHTVIDDGVRDIMIKKGYTPILQLDTSTKAYVNADFIGEESIRKVSIGAYNANTRNGRLYLPDIGKTVPFVVGKGLDAGTYTAISYSLDRYVNGLGSEIEVASEEVLAADGRIKRLKILRAFRPTSTV